MSLHVTGKLYTRFVLNVLCQEMPNHIGVLIPLHFLSFLLICKKKIYLDILKVIGHVCALDMGFLTPYIFFSAGRCGVKTECPCVAMVALKITL